ncbi:unnamed protein product, partial [Didymodactylos carnosus]
LYEEDDVDHGSEDVEIPSTLQDSSDESDDGVVEKDSGDESDASTVESGSISDDEPPRRRAKRQPQVEQSPVQIFTAKSGIIGHQGNLPNEKYHQLISYGSEMVLDDQLQ